MHSTKFNRENKKTLGRLMELVTVRHTRRLGKVRLLSEIIMMHCLFSIRRLKGFDSKEMLGVVLVRPAKICRLFSVVKITGEKKLTCMNLRLCDFQSQKCECRKTEKKNNEKTNAGQLKGKPTYVHIVRHESVMYNARKKFTVRACVLY
jgi:hypothetical protein